MNYIKLIRIHSVLSVAMALLIVWIVKAVFA